MTTLIGLFHQGVIEQSLICVEQIHEVDKRNDIVAFVTHDKDSIFEKAREASFPVQDEKLRALLKGLKE